MKNIKLIGSLTGVILMIFLCCTRKTVNEYYVLPNDFYGPVIVKFDDLGGSHEKFDNKGNRVLHIPSTGFLRTRFKFQESWRDIRYFRENGIELKYLWPDDKIWEDTSNISQLSDSIYVYRAAHSKDYWFIVGRIGDLDSLSKEMNDKWAHLSKPVTMKKGDSIGKVRHNKAF